MTKACNIDPHWGRYRSAQMTDDSYLKPLRPSGSTWWEARTLIYDVRLQAAWVLMALRWRETETLYTKKLIIRALGWGAAGQDRCRRLVEYGYAKPTNNVPSVKRPRALAEWCKHVKRELLAKQGFLRCEICGKVANTEFAKYQQIGQFDAHHIIPVAWGGRQMEVENIAILCRACHVDAGALGPKWPPPGSVYLESTELAKLWRGPKTRRDFFKRMGVRKK